MFLGHGYPGNGRDHGARRTRRHDGTRFSRSLNDSVMGSTFTRYKTRRFVNLDFKPTFTPVLLKKTSISGMAERKT